MKPILFIAILVFAVAAVGGYLLADRFLRQQAIDACLKAATVESVTTKTEGANTYTNTYKLPIEEWYNRCMEQKGQPV